MTTVQLLLTILSNDVQQARIGGLLYLRLKQTKNEFQFQIKPEKITKRRAEEVKKRIYSNGVLAKHTAL